VKRLPVAGSLIVAALAAAPAAHADDPGDGLFAMLLKNDGLLFNLPLEKYQGQRYCRSVIDGEKPYQATDDLVRDGGYSRDVAFGITFAAGLAYCHCADNAADGIAVPSTQCSPYEVNYRRGGL
jgi:hypothetical protein